jgi:hypothetical protein
VRARGRADGSPDVSSALNENQEVVRANPCCAVGGWVEATDELLEGADELLPSPLGLQYHAGADERSEVRRVLLDSIIDRVEVELDGLVLDRRLGADRAKDVVDVGLDPPQRRGLDAGGAEAAGTTRSM